MINPVACEHPTEVDPSIAGECFRLSMRAMKRLLNPTDYRGRGKGKFKLILHADAAFWHQGLCSSSNIGDT